MKLRYMPFAIGLFLSVVSCTAEQRGKSRGAIVLGDSSTIITETNPELLQDQVVDLRPSITSDEDQEPAPGATDTLATEPAATEPAQQTVAAPPAGNGLNVPFKEVTLFIPDITTKSFGKPDLQKARGASYQLTGGTLAGKQLRVSGSPITKVSQRYETIAVLETGGKTLSLESMGKFTSPWQSINGSNGAYSISGLEPSKLQYKSVNNGTIRNAVQQAARRQRLSRAETQNMLDAVRNVRAANQAPLRVAVRSVMWRVEGKGFSKELRVDLPVQ
jgi:hypothetical protein